MTFLAVTLEGTIIHKSGLITGGRSTHSSSKKWDEKDVQGAYSIFLSSTFSLKVYLGLRRARDALKNQLQELLKQRPRGRDDDDLIEEIGRLESNIVSARDDLVIFFHFVMTLYLVHLSG